MIYFRITGDIGHVLYLRLEPLLRTEIFYLLIDGKDALQGRFKVGMLAKIEKIFKEYAMEGKSFNVQLQSDDDAICEDREYLPNGIKIYQRIPFFPAEELLV